MEIFQELINSGITTFQNAENPSSFRSGGNVALVAEPENAADLKLLSRLLPRGEFFVMGAGSNILFPDSGYGGVALSSKRLRGLEVIGNSAFIGAGEKLQSVISRLAIAGFSGLEELSGIPCSVGGALFQNAGAFNREMSDLVVRASVFDLETSDFYFLSSEELDFSYRKSSVRMDRELIVGAELKLVPSAPDKIQARRSEILCRRRELHPKEPSLGCAFKKANGVSAGKLIDLCNLKGKSVGGAKISEKHAGFIVNTGNASSADYLALATFAKKTVKAEKGIDLEFEIRVL